MAAAIQNLENDHVFILRLIDVINAMVDGKCTNSEHFQLVIDLVRNYADGLHHIKEEKHLFPLMVANGFSTEQGPIALMLSEHEMGREFIRYSATYNDMLKAGNTSVLSKIYINLKSYANLLTNHIQKENNVLFRMADQVLSDEDQERLFLQFEEAEKKADPQHNSTASVKAINTLAEMYLQ